MAGGEPLLPPLHERDRRPALRVGDARAQLPRAARRRGGVARRVAGAERVGVWAEPSLETCVAIVGALGGRRRGGAR